jgi:hypothetical protein
MMKKVLIAAALSVGFTAVSQASDNAPVALADVEMDQIVAGRAHQGEKASELKGGVADLMPGHVLGLEGDETPGGAHQSGASALKGDITTVVPDHVRGNL